MCTASPIYLRLLLVVIGASHSVHEFLIVGEIENVHSSGTVTRCTSVSHAVLRDCFIRFLEEVSASADPRIEVLERPGRV